MERTESSLRRYQEHLFERVCARTPPSEYLHSEQKVEPKHEIFLSDCFRMIQLLTIFSSKRSGVLQGGRRAQRACF